MDAIAYQQSEIDDAELRIAIRRRHFLDIGFGTGDGVCQRGDDAALVLHFHPQLHGELALHARVPSQRYELLRIVPHFCHVLAVLGMHDHAAAGADITHDRIARNRVAAFREAHQQAFGAADRQCAVAAGFLCGGSAVVVGGYQASRHDERHAIAEPYVFQQIIQHFEIGFFQQATDAPFWNVGQVVAIARQRFVQQTPAKRYRFGPTLVLQEVADIAACLAGNHKTQPRRIRMRARRNDLHRLPALQRLTQRRQFAVDAARHAGIAHIGMHGVGEIHRR